MENGNKGAVTEVYVVSSGDYERYGTEAIFSDKSKAEEFSAELESGHVQAWPVDEQVGWITHQEHFCRLYLSDGSVRHAVTYNYYLPVPPDMMPRCQAFEITDGDTTVKAVSPISARHARRLAFEARQKHLKENSQ